MIFSSTMHLGLTWRTIEKANTKCFEVISSGSGDMEVFALDTFIYIKGVSSGMGKKRECLENNPTFG